MRGVLIPIGIAGACNLYQAIRWITAHEYPLTDMAMQGWAQVASGADLHDTHAQDESARERLFGQLVTGNLTAYGHLTDEEPPTQKESDDPNDEFLRSTRWSILCVKISGELGQRTAIPESAWRSKNILWDYNALRTAEGLYANIAIPTEDLFKRFPEPVAASVPAVEQRGGTLLVKISANAAASENRRGRPPEFEWDVFHAQVAKLLLERGGLPKKKADLAIAMQEWCAHNWGKEPADSAIRSKIAVYYAVIGDPRGNSGRD